MQTKRIRSIALALTIAAASSMAGAAGWGAIFADGPVQDFHDEDLRLYLEAIKKALDAPGTPQPVPWRNDASGAGGTLVVLGEPKVKDFGECRRVKSTVYSKKRQGYSSTWTACKDAGGRWVLVGVG